MRLNPFRQADFLYFYSLQAGVVICSSIGIFLAVTSLVVNLASENSEIENNIIVGQYILVSFYCVISLLGFLLGLVSAYQEKFSVIYVSISLQALMLLYWLVLLILSFYNHPYFTRRICIQYRCADHLWIQDARWRYYVIICDPEDRNLPVIYHPTAASVLDKYLNVWGEPGHHEVLKKNENMDGSGGKIGINKPANITDMSKIGINKPANKTDMSKIGINKPANKTDMSKIGINKPANKTDMSKIGINKPANKTDMSKIGINKPGNKTDMSKIRINKPANKTDIKKIRINKPANKTDMSKIRINKPTNKTDMKKIRINKPANKTNMKKIRINKPANKTDINNMSNWPIPDDDDHLPSRRVLQRDDVGILPGVSEKVWNPQSDFGKGGLLAISIFFSIMLTAFFVYSITTLISYRNELKALEWSEDN